MANNPIDLKIEGLDPVLARLKALDAVPKGPLIRSALGKAAAVVRDEARLRAKALDIPDDEYSIPKNIVSLMDAKVNRRVAKTGILAARVGIYGTTAAGKLKAKGKPPEHWPWVEFGTENMAAQPFMRPALPASAEEATAKFTAGLDAAIDKALAKQSGK
ncbi:HK97 gp10 family phage protein [Halomonas cupida]|uniref:HK97-gp10 family putative phage morphogenesis protein n=1 Tax=Halomonas cupida TaxID=44933 RepID=UPI0039B529E1